MMHGDIELKSPKQSTKEKHWSFFVCGPRIILRCFLSGTMKLYSLARHEVVGQVALNRSWHWPWVCLVPALSAGIRWIYTVEVSWLSVCGFKRTTSHRWVPGHNRAEMRAQMRFSRLCFVVMGSNPWWFHLINSAWLATFTQVWFMDQLGQKITTWWLFLIIAAVNYTPTTVWSK